MIHSFRWEPDHTLIRCTRSNGTMSYETVGRIATQKRGYVAYGNNEELAFVHSLEYAMRLVESKVI